MSESLSSSIKTMNEFDILERLKLLDPRTTTREQEDRLGRKWWSVFMPHILFSMEGCGARSFDPRGETKLEALQAAWKLVLKYSESPFFIIRENGINGVDLWGDLPQVWVRWDPEGDTWMDVEPTERMVKAREIRKNLIRKFWDQLISDHRATMQIAN